MRNQRQGLPAWGIPLHPGVALKLPVLCPPSTPAVRDRVHESGTTRQPSPGHATTTRPGLWRTRAASLERGVAQNSVFINNASIGFYSSMVQDPQYRSRRVAVTSRYLRRAIRGGGTTMTVWLTSDYQPVQTRSKRSSSMTFIHAATKSTTNLSRASSLA